MYSKFQKQLKQIYLKMRVACQSKSSFCFFETFSSLKISYNMSENKYLYIQLVFLLDLNFVHKQFFENFWIKFFFSFVQIISFSNIYPYT